MTTRGARRGRRPAPTVNITPLLDVLLVLVVILMLALPLSVNRLAVDLPQASLSGIPVPAQSLFVAVQGDGTLLLEGSQVELAAVLGRVTSQTTVELAVDRAARYEQLAPVLAEIQRAGPAGVNLLAR